MGIHHRDLLGLWNVGHRGKPLNSGMQRWFFFRGHDPGFRGHQIWVWGSGENSQPDEHAELELSAQMLGLHIPHLPARLGGHEEKEG